MEKRIAIQVLGCRTNQVEADFFREQFIDLGWKIAKSDPSVDVCLIHSCTVTAEADVALRTMLRRLQRINPTIKIFISGCAAELDSNLWSAEPNVVRTFGLADRTHMAAKIEQLMGGSAHPVEPQLEFDFFGSIAHILRSAKTRAHIKIQDGCQGVCAYCRVRLARPRPVSLPLPQVLERVAACVEHGFREIVLTGISLGAYAGGLPTLMKSLAKISGDFRIRFSSLEPHQLTLDLAEVWGSAPNRFCPHLHLAIQSADNQVLHAMRRPYSAEDLARCLETFRKFIPGLVVSGDFIVGFPGEDEQAFQTTCAWVRRQGVVRLHVFPFSARAGTEAQTMPEHVPYPIKKQRARLLRAISREQTLAYRQARMGTLAQVIIERQLGQDRWLGTCETHDRAIVEVRGKKGEMFAGRICGIEGECFRIESWI